MNYFSAPRFGTDPDTSIRTTLSFSSFRNLSIADHIPHSATELGHEKNNNKKTNSRFKKKKKSQFRIIEEL